MLEKLSTEKSSKTLSRVDKFDITGFASSSPVFAQSPGEKWMRFKISVVWNVNNLSGVFKVNLSIFLFQ